MNIIPFLHQTTTGWLSACKSAWLNIIPFLHQTTTISRVAWHSHWLNIIPFLHQTTTSKFAAVFAFGWISFHFYIKPKPDGMPSCNAVVEYHSIFTSNHNRRKGVEFKKMLNIIPFLHQTTTVVNIYCHVLLLNIIPFLHQTTTSGSENRIGCSWISFHFYIKPQLSLIFHNSNVVEYHSIFTSNHNINEVVNQNLELNIIPFLHQTTTWSSTTN